MALMLPIFQKDIGCLIGVLGGATSQKIDEGVQGHTVAFSLEISDFNFGTAIACGKQLCDLPIAGSK